MSGANDQTCVNSQDERCILLLNAISKKLIEIMTKTLEPNLVFVLKELHCTTFRSKLSFNLIAITLIVHFGEVLIVGSTRGIDLGVIYP